SVALKRAGVAAARVGKVQAHLAGHAAVGAGDARDRQDDPDRLTADGDSPKRPRLLAVRVDVARATDGAAVGVRALADGGDHAALLVGRAHVIVAANAEGMVQ